MQELRDRLAKIGVRLKLVRPTGEDCRCANRSFGKIEVSPSDAPMEALARSKLVRPIGEDCRCANRSFGKIEVSPSNAPMEAWRSCLARPNGHPEAHSRPRLNLARPNGHSEA